MKRTLKKIFISLALLTLVSCINKSQFDTLHAPYYNLPWDFSISSLNSDLTSTTISWGHSNKALSYSVLYKDLLNPAYATVSTNASSPYTINGLTRGHTYLIKIIALNSFGTKESNVLPVSITSPPITTSSVLANILAGTSRTITLAYTDADGDLATACSASTLTGLIVSSSCQCNTGVCTVGVTGLAGYFGTAEFDYTVTANNQISNSATVNFDYLCPTGYIAINGNAIFGVNGFCVMQFEAKNIGGVAASQALLTPWNNISLPTAKSNCQSLGSKYDIISNPEWMTIARGIESRATNWSGGSVNSGMLNSGHSDSTFASNDILDVTDSTDPYDGTGNNGGQAPGAGWEQKRTHSVLNGNIIWDFSGNLNEWVDWSLASGIQSITPANKAYNSSDANPLSTAIDFTTLDTFITSSNEMFPNSWQATNTLLTSVNRIGTYTAGTNSSGGYARRGGIWSSLSEAGIYSLDLSANSNSTFNETGFRCVYRP